ncbi:sugar efflux transporter [Micromonospora sp. NPDC048905]|uniref:sugar efflux transporter n=1 Tax=unclassified Micromonospora TaxID=2617518 RepID=UPI0033FF4C05
MSEASEQGRGGRHLIALGIVFIAVGLSAAMATPYLTLFLDEALRADTARIAVFLAAAPISAVIVASLFGRLSDRLPHRRGILLITALAGVASSGLSAIVRNYWLFLLITVTLTAVANAVMPQIFAYARESLGGGSNVAMQMSTFRMLFSVSWVAGPPLASLLLAAGGFAMTYAFSALMYVTVAVVVLAVLRRRQPATAEHDHLPHAVEAATWHPAIWMSVGAFTLLYAASNLAVQALPLFVLRELDAGIGSAGLLLGLCAGLEIPLMIGFGYLATRVPIHRLLVIGTGCGLAYMVSVAYATDVWQLMAAQLLNAATVAAVGGLGITYVQDLLPRERGRASTLYTNTIPIGALLAGPVLGAAQQTGYRVSFVIGAFLYAGAVLLLFLTNFLNRTRLPKTPGPATPVIDQRGAGPDSTDSDAPTEDWSGTASSGAKEFTRHVS